MCLPRPALIGRGTPFANLADLADLEGEPTIERAQTLGRALKAVPDLQTWLREQRQLTVRALLDGRPPRKTWPPRLEVSPQRVADIASGHSRTKAKRTKPAARPVHLAGALSGRVRTLSARMSGQWPDTSPAAVRCSRVSAGQALSGRGARVPCMSGTIPAGAGSSSRHQDHGRRLAGTIPAGAGSRSPMSGIRSRMRGTIPAGAGSSVAPWLGVSMLAGTIPAGAGSRSTRRLATSRQTGPSPRVRGAGRRQRHWAASRDHPRGCGEQVDWRSQPSGTGGTIPAGAGSRAAAAAGRTAWRDHPRGCGEQGRRDARHAASGTIPAGAGSSLLLARTRGSPHTAAHPRCEAPAGANAATSLRTAAVSELVAATGR